MFSEVWQDFHVIQVTVDGVQVLVWQKKSHQFYMWAKNLLIPNIRKTSFDKQSLQFPTTHIMCGSFQNMPSAYSLKKKRKKDFKRWAHCAACRVCQRRVKLVPTLWLSLSGCAKRCLSNCLHPSQTGSETSTDRSPRNLKIVLYQNQLSKH